MTHNYTIFRNDLQELCGKSKCQLITMAGVEAAEVQLDAPQATITMQKHIAISNLQAAVLKASNYRIEAAAGGTPHRNVF